MTTLQSAIYLLGHGPQRQPRFLELQYRRIARYSELFCARHPFVSSPSAVFADLNLLRGSQGVSTPEELPELLRLRSLVQAKQFGTVFLDLDENPGLGSFDLLFVRTTLEAVRARVLNAFYDEEHVFGDTLKEQYGQHARPHEVDDAADLVGFFPATAAAATAASLRRQLAECDAEDPAARSLRRRIVELQDKNPYLGGRSPFIDDGLADEWSRKRLREYKR
jgi:hypothetical protein